MRPSGSLTPTSDAGSRGGSHAFELATSLPHLLLGDPRSLDDGSLPSKFRVRSFAIAGRIVRSPASHREMAPGTDPDEARGYLRSADFRTTATTSWSNSTSRTSR